MVKLNFQVTYCYCLWFIIKGCEYTYVQSLHHAGGSLSCDIGAAIDLPGSW